MKYLLYGMAPVFLIGAVLAAVNFSTGVKVPSQKPRPEEKPAPPPLPTLEEIKHDLIGKTLTCSNRTWIFRESDDIKVEKVYRTEKEWGRPRILAIIQARKRNFFIHGEIILYYEDGELKRVKPYSFSSISEILE